MNGFNQLTDKSKINVEPSRIRIKKVATQMDLRQALKSFGTPDDQLENLALLNGKTLNDTIEANTMLKTIEKGR